MVRIDRPIRRRRGRVVRSELRVSVGPALSLSTKNFLTLNVSYEHIRTFVFCFLRILGP